MGSLVASHDITRMLNSATTSREVPVIHSHHLILASIHQTGGVQKLCASLVVPDIGKDYPSQTRCDAVLLALGKNFAGSTCLNATKIDSLLVVLFGSEFCTCIRSKEAISDLDWGPLSPQK